MPNPSPITSNGLSGRRATGLPAVGGREPGVSGSVAAAAESAAAVVVHGLPARGESREQVLLDGVIVVDELEPYEPADPSAGIMYENPPRLRVFKPSAPDIAYWLAAGELEDAVERGDATLTGDWRQGPYDADQRRAA